MGKKETNIANEICVELCKRGCKVFRSQSGLFYTPNGDMIRIGVVGQSDYHGHTADGKAFYLETKTKNGKPTAEQIAFITAMLNSGALAGVVRSVDHALAVLGGSKDYIQ